ncbi:MAG: threonine ammonia-lyase [Chloroflexi bacterium]|nr:threonine ammonia-lyase [Chloroflexota bacterium]
MAEESQANEGRIPTFQDIERALPVVRRTAHRTPMLSSRQLSAMAGCRVLLKAECLQRTGSFKIRGALSKVASLNGTERQAGIIAASAGNHAQGVALAAREAGIPCTIVMPVGASLAKVEATRGYGAAVIPYGDSFEKALGRAQALAQEQGLTLVHAFDDPLIVAGQGTLGVEIAEDASDAGVVLVPVGGGGLIAGVALAVKELSPGARVIGVQTTSAPAAERSFHQKRRLRVPSKPTLADGIAVGEPGAIPLRVMRRYVDDMVTVSEEAIAHAQALLLERAKLLVEGAGAVGVAALLERAVAVQESDVAVAVLSGGNVDMNLVSRILEHGLAQAGRYQLVEVVLADKPGQLARLLAVLAEAEVNVLDVDHVRHEPGLPFGHAMVEVTGETRNREHAEEMTRRLQEAGYLLVSVPVPGSIEPARFVAQEA